MQAAGSTLSFDISTQAGGAALGTEPPSLTGEGPDDCVAE